jgi:hypothetical protein
VLGDGETAETDLVLAGDGRLVSVYTSLRFCVERRSDLMAS